MGQWGISAAGLRRRLSQPSSTSLGVGGAGWTLSHFTKRGASPFGTGWTANPSNPVVKGGDLFGQICAGSGKHCQVGTTDEGTPQIVEKAFGEFFITFHGYDYSRNKAVRGVARTEDFVSWNTAGGGLPNDAIFSAADCAPREKGVAAASPKLGSLCPAPGAPQWE